MLLSLVVIIVGATIRRRYIMNGKLNVGAWIKLDFVMLIVIASLAALLSVAEPNPPNEPLHWHVMGEDGAYDGRDHSAYSWRQSICSECMASRDAGDPKDVSMQLTEGPDGVRR